MIAVDTNILIRLLVSQDHPAQTEVAKAIFEENEVALSHTVLLEAEWVLRRAFNFTRDEIAHALAGVLAMRTVFCRRRESVFEALRAFREGCDFADALHATTSNDGVEAFLTFDRDFARRAASLGLRPSVSLVWPANHG